MNAQQRIEHRKRNLRRITGAAALALAGMTLGAPHARAAGVPVCVATNAELGAALASAAFVPATIEIAAGTYDLRDTVLHESAALTVLQGGTELLGGYGADCAKRTIEVGNTVLDDSSAATASASTGSELGATLYGDFTAEGITWAVAPHFMVGSPAQPLSVGATVQFRRDAVLNQSRSFRISWWDDGVGADGTIRIVDTLVAGNNGADCAVFADIGRGAPRVELINDTIVDNGGKGGGASGFCMSNAADARGSLVATNDIFYGNARYDIDTGMDFSDPVAASLVADSIGPHRTPLGVEVATDSADPRLDADYRPIESPPSPAIDTGVASVAGGLPAKDLAGRDRLIGMAPDRGAFESYHTDGFLQTVSNTHDSGSGSLRAAIDAVNANGSGLITFDIGSDCGPQIITLQSDLPLITVPLIINGYTQTGATENDLQFGDDAVFCVVLEAGGSATTHGLHVPEAADENATLVAKGLAFSGFSVAAIDLNGAVGHNIVGNRFGGNASGHTLLPNGIGVRVGAGSNHVTIGGDDIASRNVIGTSTTTGISLLGSTTGNPPVASGTHDDSIIDNMIGVGWSLSEGDFTHLGNGTRGVFVSGYHNTISGNWIGWNTQSGIALDGGAAIDNTIQANYIGFPWGSNSYGNGQAGIHLEGTAGDAPETNTITQNVIADNGAQGVWVEVGQHNTVRLNGIYYNFGLGIDLAAAGVMPNDDDGGVQPADYANHGLNYPVLTSASGTDSSGTFTGSLTTVPGDYQVDLYQTASGCDQDDYRQGQGRVATITVTVGAAPGSDQGTATFSVQEGAGDLGQLYNNGGITATTTDVDGDTSEFSACVPYHIGDVIFANGFDS